MAPRKFPSQCLSTQLQLLARYQHIQFQAMSILTVNMAAWDTSMLRVEMGHGESHTLGECGMPCTTNPHALWSMVNQSMRNFEDIGLQEQLHRVKLDIAHTALCCRQM